MGSNDFSDDQATRRNVTKVLVHPHWDKVTFDNDLALLKLDRKVTFSSSLMPICLPEDKEESFIGKTIIKANLT